MKTKTIIVYADPGHAWAKVEKSFLIKLGIEKEISIYSYMRGESAYIEEDSDLNKLVITMRDKGINHKFKEFHANKSSKIRNYASYKS